MIPCGWVSIKYRSCSVSTRCLHLVGRTTGNQRVLVNSKLFPETVLEKVTERRLKISAKNPDVDLPQLFLIQVMCEWW